MPASPTGARRLNRTKMKNDQQCLVETEKCSKSEIAKTDQKDEEFLSCEITTICNQHMNKKVVLPLSKDENSSEKMPGISLSFEDPNKSISLRKENVDRSSKNRQLSFGLTDLGSNSQVSLPSRPLTTGRLLPHIGHKHFQRDSSILGAKSSTSGCINSASGSRKTGIVIKTHTDSHSQDFKKTEADRSVKKLEPKQPSQTKLSSLSVKTAGHDTSGCLLNPNTLNPCFGAKLAPTPPSRKPIRMQPNGSGSEHISKEPTSPRPCPPGNNKVIPSSDFKPIISVRNLELNHSKSLLKSNRPLNRSVETTSDRTLLNRDRVDRLRHSHPPPTPRNSNKLLATVAKASLG